MATKLLMIWLHSACYGLCVFTGDKSQATRQHMLSVKSRISYIHSKSAIGMKAMQLIDNKTMAEPWFDQEFWDDNFGDFDQI